MRNEWHTATGLTLWNIENVFLEFHRGLNSPNTEPSISGEHIILMKKWLLRGCLSAKSFSCRQFVACSSKLLPFIRIRLIVLWRVKLNQGFCSCINAYWLKFYKVFGSQKVTHTAVVKGRLCFRTNGQVLFFMRSWEISKDGYRPKPDLLLPCFHSFGFKWTSKYV